MKIADTTGPALAVYLSPDDCLMLAQACQIAFEHADDGRLTNTQEQVTTGALFLTLAHLCEAYALVGQALASLPPDERHAFDLAAIRRAWGVLPHDRRAS